MVKKKDTNKNAILIFAGAVAVIFIAIALITALVGTEIDRTETADARIIPIQGEITSQGVGGFFSTGPGSADIVNQIRSEDEDTSTDAIYLEIDSPGGTPVASHEIVRAVDEADKPTVAVIRDMGASGAYWVASASDHVIADELSMTGSVGVQGSYLVFEGLMERYNVSYEQITGGEHKDLGNPFKEMDDEERSEFTSKVELMHDYFIEDVRDKRNLTEDQVEEVSTGVFYVGLEAIDINLVDELGGDLEAKNYLEEELNASVNFIRREESIGFFDIFFGFNQGFELPLKLR